MKTIQLDLIPRLDYLMSKQDALACRFDFEDDPFRLNRLIKQDKVREIFETLLERLPFDSQQKIGVIAQSCSNKEIPKEKTVHITILHAIQDETVDRIIQIAEDILEGSDSSQVFSELTHTWLHHEQTNKALEFAEKIQDPEKQAKAFSAIVIRLCSSRRLDEADIYINKIDDRFTQLKPFKEMALAYSSSGKWVNADRYVSQISPLASQFEVLNTMALHALRYGRSDLAFHLADRITDDVKRFECYSKLAINLNKGRKEIDKIINIVNRITDPSIRRSTIGYIVADLAHLGNFKYMEEYVGKIENETERSVVISNALLYLRRQKMGPTESPRDKPNFPNRFKQVDESQQVQMIKDAEILERGLKVILLERNLDQRLKLLCSIIINFISIKNFERGVEIIEQFVHPSHQDRLLLDIVKQLDATYKLDPATKLIEKIQDPDIKVELFENIPNVIKSPDYLGWLRSFLGTLKDDNDRGIALTDIGITLVKDGDSELTSELVREYLEEDHSLQKVVFINIATRLVEERYDQLANDLIQQIKTQEIRDVVKMSVYEFMRTNQILKVMEVVLGLVQIGKDEEANRFLQTIENPEVRREVIERLQRSSN